jgi:hypothetical protein
VLPASIRLPASLLLHARALATMRDETLAQVGRRALRANVAGAQPISLGVARDERSRDPWPPCALAAAALSDTRQPVASRYDDRRIDPAEATNTL